MSPRRKSDATENGAGSEEEKQTRFSRKGVREAILTMLVEDRLIILDATSEDAIKSAQARIGQTEELAARLGFDGPALLKESRYMAYDVRLGVDG